MGFLKVAVRLPLWERDRGVLPSHLSSRGIPSALPGQALPRHYYHKHQHHTTATPATPLMLLPEAHRRYQPPSPTPFFARGCSIQYCGVYFGYYVITELRGVGLAQGASKAARPKGESARQKAPIKEKNKINM